MFERVAKLVKTDRVRSWRLYQLPRSIFLTEFVSAFFLAMRYFFKPKAPERRGALHRLQVVRGDLPGTGHHDRGGTAAQRRHAADHPLRCK